MTDIVERLRDTSKFETWEDLTGLIVEAADEIERLRKLCEPITVTGDPDTISADSLKNVRTEKEKL